MLNLPEGRTAVSDYTGAQFQGLWFPYDIELDHAPWHNLAKQVGWLTASIVTDPGFRPYDLITPAGERWSVHAASLLFHRCPDGIYQFKRVLDTADAAVFVCYERQPLHCYWLCEASAIYLLPSHIRDPLLGTSGGLMIPRTGYSAGNKGRWPERDLRGSVVDMDTLA